MQTQGSAKLLFFFHPIKKYFIFCFFSSVNLTYKQVTKRATTNKKNKKYFAISKKSCTFANSM